GRQSSPISFDFLFFFFSSRRRHTRCLSDWSSDVCSSDLLVSDDLAVVYAPLVPIRVMELLHERGSRFVEVPDEEYDTLASNVLRSEERRVGKECRSRWSGEDEKKKHRG